MDIETFIHKIPKAELHLHLDGTLEPELMFKIAQRNGISLQYKSVEEVRTAYNFNNLQSFLDLYYQGAGVLREEQDFYDLTFAYLSRAHKDNIRHAELFYNPQTHTSRGISFETVTKGTYRAMQDAEKQFKITSLLILGILRHLSCEEALETLKTSLKYKDYIVGVGLDSSEVGHPPSKFKEAFKFAKENNFLLVSHAGEEAPPSYVWEALQLPAQRIDHGVQSVHDPQLLQHLRDQQIPLTVCPLSNTKLKVYPTMKEHSIKQLFDYGLKVTVNSDDPAFFGGYLNDNFLAIQKCFDFDFKDIYQMCKNSFEASFLSQEAKDFNIKELDKFLNNYLLELEGEKVIQ